ncbi:MAG: hypothetical protein FJ302_09405 [Planctomycetes bacterium]|nr:hypothetical protein [Planctomycetota bacterium]
MGGTACFRRRAIGIGNRKSTAVVPSKKSKSSRTASQKPNLLPTNNNDSTAGDKRKRIRFIRIELPRKGVLTLVEVEAITDGHNVASYGFAEQKTQRIAAPRSEPSMVIRPGLALTKPTTRGSNSIYENV